MNHAVIINKMVTDRAMANCNNDSVKAQFKKSGMHLMKRLAVLVGGTEKDVRYNAGGSAVSGDITLHTECIYVSMNLDSSSSFGFLVRTCNGKKDYTGDRNNWFQFDTLNYMSNLADMINRMIAEKKAINIMLSNKNTASVI